MSWDKCPVLMLEADSGKEVALWRSTLLSRWSKQSSSRPMSPAYFLHVSFMKMSISCLLKYIVSILQVIFLKSTPLLFKETLISFNIKQQWGHWKGDTIRHCATGNVNWTFCPKLLSTRNWQWEAVKNETLRQKRWFQSSHCEFSFYM